MSSLESFVSGGTHGNVVFSLENALLRIRMRDLSLALAAFLCWGLCVLPEARSCSTSSFRRLGILPGLMQRPAVELCLVASLILLNTPQISFSSQLYWVCVDYKQFIMPLLHTEYTKYLSFCKVDVIQDSLVGCRVKHC